MTDEEAIAQQQRLLTTYRRTLVQLLRQAAQFGGESFAPPQVANGITEARTQIRQIKAGLRSGGASVADLPIDEPSATPPETDVAGQPGGKNIGAPTPGQAGQQIAFSGGTNYGAVVAANTGTINVTSAPSSAQPSPALTIDGALAEVERALGQARGRGDDDLADDLQVVVLALQVALKAHGDGKSGRRAAKLTEARDSLRRIVRGQPALLRLAHMLDAVASS